MKNYGKLWRKALILAALIACLGWIGYDGGAANVQANSCCESCEAITAACVSACNGNTTCEQSCVRRGTHCFITCEYCGGGGDTGNSCQYGYECISNSCTGGYCDPY